jgi:lysophospholipase L1-like esterase
VLSYVELDDGATVVPHKFDCKIFFIGDSITQGWNSTYDSLSYANRVSDFFNADSIIQGVGGAFFHPTIFDDAIDYDPDIVIFAFGTNDWGIQKSHDELCANTAAFIEAITKKFAGKKIFGLSPIWRGNSGELKPAGYFPDVCKTVKEEILKHGVTLIDGYQLTPHMTDFFSDLYLHPNGLGFGVYAENLCKILKEYI